MVDIVELINELVMKMFNLRKQLNFMCFLCIIYIVNIFFQKDVQAFTNVISEFVAESFPNFHNKIYIILNGDLLYNTTKLITRFNLVVGILFISILIFQLVINNINYDFVTNSGIQYNLDTLGVLTVTSFNIYIDVLIINRIFFSSRIFNVFILNEQDISIVSLVLSAGLSFSLILAMFRYGIVSKNKKL